MKTIVIIYSIAAQMQHVYMPSQKKIRHAVKEREGNSHLRTAQLRVRVKAVYCLYSSPLCFKLSQALRIFILF